MSQNQDQLYATETMAELCASQGRLSEAILIFRRLLDSHPGSSRCDHWSQRLQTLEQTLRLARNPQRVPDLPRWNSGGGAACVPTRLTWGPAAEEGRPRDEQEIEPEPLPLPPAPGVAVETSEDSVTVAWALPAGTTDPALELLLIQKTSSGIETIRRFLRLPATQGRVAYTVPALHSALAAVGQGEGTSFVPLALSTRST